MKLVSLADRPDLFEAFMKYDELWPAFMLEDPYGRLLGRLGIHFADTAFLVEEGDEILGRAIAVPVPWSKDTDLPARGWDAAIEAAVEAAVSGAQATSLCALEITLNQSTRGRGVSSSVVSLLRDHSRSHSFEALYAPVRPTEKADRIHQSMEEYLASDLRADGLPADPWLRIHARLGATVVGVAPTSMVIAASFDDWTTWTGLNFHAIDSDVVEVPGALVPVALDRVNRVATYVEPNVWCRHDLRESAIGESI